MKKILIFMITVMLMITLVACKTTNNGETDSNDQTIKRDDTYKVAEEPADDSEIIVKTKDLTFTTNQLLDLAQFIYDINVHQGSFLGTPEEMEKEKLFSIVSAYDGLSGSATIKQYYFDNYLAIDYTSIEEKRKGALTEDIKTFLEEKGQEDTFELYLETLYIYEYQPIHLYDEISQEDIDAYVTSKGDEIMFANARHILVEEEATANEVMEKINSGTDFNELVKEYSIDPGSNTQDGRLVFPKGQMVKEFEDASFTQEIGVVGEPVQTQFGYHIIIVDNRFSYSEARDYFLEDSDVGYDIAKEDIVKDLQTKYGESVMALRSETLKEIPIKDKLISLYKEFTGNDITQERIDEIFLETGYTLPE